MVLVEYKNAENFDHLFKKSKDREEALRRIFQNDLSIDLSRSKR